MTFVPLRPMRIHVLKFKPSPHALIVTITSNMNTLCFSLLASSFKWWLSYGSMWSSHHRSVLQVKRRSLHRYGSLLKNTAIMAALASVPFLCTMSISSRALSCLGRGLTASHSYSFRTSRDRRSSNILSRTGSDTRAMKCARMFRSFPSAEVFTGFGFSAGGVCGNISGKGIWFNNQSTYFQRERIS